MEDFVNLRNKKSNKKLGRRQYLTVKDIMSYQLYRIYLNDDISFALIKLEELNINYINVFNAKGEVVGTLSRFNINFQKNKKVSEYIDQDFLIIYENDSYKASLMLLLESNKECIVVKKKNDVVGNFNIDNIYRCGDI